MDSIKKWLPRLADALFPRRCPFCGALLGAAAFIVIRSRKHKNEQ